MVFLLAVLICMALSAMASFRQLSNLFEGERIPIRDRVLVLGSLMSSTALGGAVMLGFLTNMSLSSDANLVPRMMLAAGLGAALCSWWLAWRKQGAWILGALAASYLAFTAADHLVFYRDGERSGTIAPQLAQHADVRCDAAMVLVRLDPARADWRCPVNMVYGAGTLDPFAPWPHYRDGSSRKLAETVEAFRTAAKAGTTYVPATR